MADLMNNLNNSIYLSTGASLDNAYRSGMPQNAGMPGVSSENPRVENLKKAAGIETDAMAGDAERLTGGKECQTCKNRKYKDGSDEMVSFKSAAHISPTQAPAAVRAHEMEHVSNAYNKASQEGGKVIRASVTIKMAICPECGRAYVSGGVTNTCIKTPADDSAYGKNLKEIVGEASKGDSLDIKA